MNHLNERAAPRRGRSEMRSSLIFHHLPFFFLHLPFFFALLSFTSLGLESFSVFSDLDPVDAQVEAVTHRAALLPCNFTSNDTAELVLWYTAKSLKPFYSYDARESEVLHWSEDPSRMVFTPSRGVGFLSLSNVQAEDQGIYRCRVDYRAARTSTFSLNLSVIVPPSKPKVWDRDGVVIKSVIGPLKEGDSLFLACEVPDGRPPPTLSWWKDGVSVGRNQTLRVNGNSRSELLLESIRRSDLHSVVECRASNTPLVAPAVAQLSIDMNLAPLSLNLHPREGTSISGVPKEFICEVVGSRPPATISWSLAGVWIKSFRDDIESFTGNVTTSVLQLTPHPDDHGKVLQCLAENRILKGQHMKASIQLNVLYPPMASLALGSSIRSAHISEGMDVYLECSIRANPPPSRVNWLRNGVPLSPEATDRSLLLKRIQWDQGGKYTCEARNSQGVGSSNVLHLSVAYAPRCSNPSPRTEYVSLGELVYVPCTVRSNPKPSAFAWVFNNTTGGVAVPPSQFTSHNFSSVLSFTPVSQFDFGSLTCTARNGVSDADSRPCVVHIVHAERPMPVGNCSQDKVNGSSVVLRCEPGTDGGLPQVFELEVYEGERVVENRSSDIPVFHLQGRDHSRGIAIYGKNAKGRSDVLWVASSSAREVSFRLPGNVLVVASVIAGLGVVMMGIGAAFCVSKVRRKRRRNATSRTLATWLPQDKSSIPLRKDTDDPSAPDGNPDIILQGGNSGRGMQTILTNDPPLARRK